MGLLLDLIYTVVVEQLSSEDRQKFDAELTGNSMITEPAARRQLASDMGEVIQLKREVRV